MAQGTPWGYFFDGLRWLGRATGAVDEGKQGVKRRERIAAKMGKHTFTNSSLTKLRCFIQFANPIVTIRSPGRLANKIDRKHSIHALLTGITQ